MRTSSLFSMTTAFFCGASFIACGTPPTTGGTMSSSSVSSGSGGEGGTGGSASGGMGGAGGSGMGGAGGGNGFGFSGTVKAPNASADSKLIVIWSVSASSPDYLYKWGDGTTDGMKFSVTLMGDPPPAAINGGFVGVGTIALVASNYVVPEGQLTSTQANDLEANVLGYSAQHAIIFHSNASQSPYPWSNQFSNGYQCGKCVPMGASFEHWAPTNCADVELVDISQPACNWT
jgi:hypothetical protein